MTSFVLFPTASQSRINFNISKLVCYLYIYKYITFYVVVVFIIFSARKVRVLLRMRAI